MAPSERESAESQGVSATTAAPATTAAGQRAAAGPVDQPRAQKPQKELLCTICNLRACWEAPEAPAATP